MRLWASNVSVEPVLFVCNLCSQISYVSSQDLMVEKACKVNFGLSEDVCGSLKEHDDSQKAVQDLVSSFLMYRSIFETAIQVVWVLVLGSWSDRWGRRMPLMFSLACLLLESAVYLIISLCPSCRMEVILIGSLPYSLSGGTHGLLMLCFAHLADLSKPRRRTTRMGFLDAAYYLGAPVGTALVGPLLDAGGYVAAFPAVIAIYGVCILYVAVRIHRPQQSTSQEPSGCATTVREAGRLCTTACDVAQLYDAVHVTVQPRPQRATAHILLLILAMMCDSLPIWGEANVKYLFVQRALGWGHTEYSRWGTFASLFSVCVMVAVVPVLSAVAGVADGWIGVVGGISKTCGSVVYGLVTSTSLTWLIWTGAAVSGGRNMAPVSIRSLLSKLAGPRAVGKVYAVMATAESLLPFAAAPLYNAVYSATNSTRPSSFNFLSAGFNFCLTLILLVVTVSMKMVSRRGAAGKTPASPAAGDAVDYVPT